MRLSTITELPPEIVAILENQGIKTDSDFLSLTAADISLKLVTRGVGLGSIKKYRDIITRTSSATGFSARRLLETSPVISPSKETHPLSTSLAPVMPALAPHTGRVVEVSGHACVKKSEFILNIVLRYLSNNSHKIVYWVDTTDELSVDKAASISSRLTQDGDHECLERIRWSLSVEVEQLYEIVEEVAESAKGDSTDIGYLVINNVTSLFGSHLTTPSSHGHFWMTEVMRELKTIAQSHSITVFVMNGSTGKSSSLAAQSLPKSPALGPTFAFLTDATVWVSIDGEHQLSHHLGSLRSDCIVHRLEVLKANFMVADIFGTFVLQSGLHLLTGT